MLFRSDVGALRDDIIEGETGFIFPPRDAQALARTMEKFFASDLFANLPSRRANIREFAFEKYSWAKVARITTEVYARLLK